MRDFECVYMYLSIQVTIRFFKVSRFCVCACTHHILISETRINPHPGFRETQFCYLEYFKRKQDTVACEHLTPVSDSCQLPAQARPQPSDKQYKKNKRGKKSAWLLEWQRTWVLSFSNERMTYNWKFRWEKVLKCRRTGRCFPYTYDGAIQVTVENTEGAHTNKMQ